MRAWRAVCASLCERLCVCGIWRATSSAPRLTQPAQSYKRSTFIGGERDGDGGLRTLVAAPEAEAEAAVGAAVSFWDGTGPLCARARCCACCCCCCCACCSNEAGPRLAQLCAPDSLQHPWG